MTQSDIGVVGLAVMGQNLARNIASRDIRVAVYNRTFARTEALINEHPDPNLVPAADHKHSWQCFRLRGGSY